ncbi:MAG TPA: hypothetical protein VIU62_24625 [Chloroflexota bacterium]|jgi:hypothetical protein
MKHLGRDRFKIGMLLAAVVVVALPFGIRSGSQRTSAQSAPSGPILHTQDVYIITGLTTSDAAGAPVSVLRSLVDQAESALGAPVALNGGLTFRRTSAVTGRAVHADGRVIANISLDFGVLTRDDMPDFEALVAVSSADISQAPVNLAPADDGGAMNSAAELAQQVIIDPAAGVILGGIAGGGVGFGLAGGAAWALDRYGGPALGPAAAEAAGIMVPLATTVGAVGGAVYGWGLGVKAGEDLARRNNMAACFPRNSASIAWLQTSGDDCPTTTHTPIPTPCIRRQSQPLPR